MLQCFYYLTSALIAMSLSPVITLSPAECRCARPSLTSSISGHDSTMWLTSWPKLSSDECYLALVQPSGESLRGKGPPDRIVSSTWRSLFLAAYPLWAKPGCCRCPVRERSKPTRTVCRSHWTNVTSHLLTWKLQQVSDWSSSACAQNSEEQ